MEDGNEDTHGEEEADTGEYYFCGGKDLGGCAFGSVYSTVTKNHGTP